MIVAEQKKFNKLQINAKKIRRLNGIWTYGPCAERSSALPTKLWITMCWKQATLLRNMYLQR